MKVLSLFGSRELRRRSMRHASILIAVALMPVPALAEDASKQGAEQGDIVFIPPKQGAPADRLGAGTRDATLSSGPIHLLAPREGGVSATAKPTLVWFLDASLDGPITVAVSPMGGFARGFVATLDGPFDAGFHGLDMRKSSAELAADVPYRWQVRSAAGQEAAAPAIVEFRSMEPPASLAEAASQGLWYDALAFLLQGSSGAGLAVLDDRALESLLASAGVDLTKIWIPQQ